MVEQNGTTPTPANDDSSPDGKAVSLTDLAKLSGIDEDTLLQRLTGILNRRNEKRD